MPNAFDEIKIKVLSNIYNDRFKSFLHYFWV